MSGGDGIEEDRRSPHVRRMDQLGEVVDRIVAVDREAAAVAARRTVLVEEARLLSEADAVASRLEAEAAGKRPRSESGWTSEVTAWRELVSELACALRLPERSTEALIANSRALCSDLPSTLTALMSGEISYRHAEKLIDHATSLPEAARASFELAALSHARELTVAKFDRKARVLRERTHPESIAVRVRAASEVQDVYCDPARDRMAYLSAYLPAHVATAGWNRVDEIATALHRADGETRTLGQIRAAVLADLVVDGVTDPVTLRSARTSLKYADLPTMSRIGDAEKSPAGVHGLYSRLFDDLQADLDQQAANKERIHATVAGVGHGVVARTSITVPALTLLDRSDEPAMLNGYGPIDADTAKELAGTASSWNRILTHPETGAVVSVGHDTYTVPADMKRHLELRDGTCRHPGCNRRVEACDLDHSLDWYYGGETACGNLAHLCKKHHQLKHHTSWRYRHTDDSGTLEFTSPTGRAYTSRPDTPIPTTPPTTAPPTTTLPAVSPPGTPPLGTRPPASGPPDSTPPDTTRPGTVHFE